ncbi:MAG: hypothetical protein JKY55_15435 [Aliivibrio sp.]|uniref:hypothetical protein n=1 Tax=Aliivibrio sp. TaxID=1872443 RepID=UPI001A4C41E9|nr:hypothetical protein [Aliivibrio sp.]
MKGDKSMQNVDLIVSQLKKYFRNEVNKTLENSIGSVLTPEEVTELENAWIELKVWKSRNQH